MKGCSACARAHTHTYTQAKEEPVLASLCPNTHTHTHRFTCQGNVQNTVYLIHKWSCSAVFEHTSVLLLLTNIHRSLYTFTSPRQLAYRSTRQSLTCRLSTPLPACSGPRTNSWWTEKYQYYRIYEAYPTTQILRLQYVFPFQDRTPVVWQINIPVFMRSFHFHPQ